ncbi:MAG TPA: magnesium transporter CorA family protein [Nocardioides sp.]|jgi:Mg2+ and Co2+ transporter CorA
MQVHFTTADGVTDHEHSDVPDLMTRTDGFVWVDVPVLDDAAEDLLVRQFRIHQRALEAMHTRNHVPTVHVYDQHTFLVLHAPLLGAAGHVHLLELDLLVGGDHLITVHGPLNPIVDPAEAHIETEAVLARLRAGRLIARSPLKVAYAISSALARRQRDLIGAVAERLPTLEQEVMSSQFRQPEALLEQLFLIRHELTTARTMAAQSHEVMARMVSIDPRISTEDADLLRDLADQFDRVRSIGDGESHFLIGVIDLYQTKVNTKMTVAMERLAVIAAVTLPITALSSVYGMNILDKTVELTIVIGVMVVMSFVLLRWTHRQGWW